jgi:acetoin utilization deacetylase AcuC-like enzyme
VKLVCGQRNDDWIVILASSLKELGRAVVRIAEDLMRECFTGAPYDDAFAFTGPGYHCQSASHSIGFCLSSRNKRTDVTLYSGLQKTW